MRTIVNVEFFFKRRDFKLALSGLKHPPRTLFATRIPHISGAGTCNTGMGVKRNRKPNRKLKRTWRGFAPSRVFLHQFCGFMNYSAVYSVYSSKLEVAQPT